VTSDEQDLIGPTVADAVGMGECGKVLASAQFLKSDE
jgi:hypothetical protein